MRWEQKRCAPHGLQTYAHGQTDPGFPHTPSLQGEWCQRGFTSPKATPSLSMCPMVQAFRTHRHQGHCRYLVRLYASPQNALRATVQDDSGFHNASEDQTRRQAGTRGQDGPHAHCVPKKATAVHEASFTAYRAQRERETSKETPGGSKQRNPKSRTTVHIPQHHRPGLSQRSPLRGETKGMRFGGRETFSD